jgi:hypothetical protein
MDSADLLTGVLHIFVAFDWGDEINLGQARSLVPASTHELPRRKRTPPSFSYRPPPLHVPQGPLRLELDGLPACDVPAGLTVFDFGAVSLNLRMPFRLAPEQVLRLAGSLAEPAGIVIKARETLRPTFETLRPAIKDAVWDDDFSEEYFVFQFPPVAMPMSKRADWLAGVVHLEGGPLSGDEVQEALRLRLSYSPSDLFVPDWTAAVLIDQDCEETLQAIEFANLQLLEYRHIDHRLDDRVAAAQRFVAALTRSVLPFWRIYHRPLRALGELKVEANDLFERTGNVLKLVGDPYLARVYRLAAQRFHLEAWEKSIQRKLDVTEGVYQVVADQASSYRMEVLELIIVLLILFEIVWAFIR